MDCKVMEEVMVDGRGTGEKGRGRVLGDSRV